MPRLSFIVVVEREKEKRENWITSVLLLACVVVLRPYRLGMVVLTTPVLGGKVMEVMGFHPMRPASRHGINCATGTRMSRPHLLCCTYGFCSGHVTFVQMWVGTPSIGDMMA